MSEVNDTAYATQGLDLMSRLAIWYGTDKAPLVGHGYTLYYDKLFCDCRDAVRKVLEIGIDRGYSLLLWRAYFPNAEIYALDSNPERMLQGVRIRSFVCNQAIEDDLRQAAAWAGTGFDLIVDDGSHEPEHQVLSARVLVPLLAPDGIYIIEDVLRPDAIVPHIPYPCETVIGEDAERDAYSKLVVIRGSQP